MGGRYPSEYAGSALERDFEGDPPSLIGLDIFSGVAIVDTGVFVPVVTMYDRNGLRTADPNRAHRFVAGRADTWYYGDVAYWRLATVH
jgi:hypothetical protein